MTEFSNGFDAGFAMALRHGDRAYQSGESIADGFECGPTKKISIGFRPDQFNFIRTECKELNCSFASAVRTIIDRAMTAPSVSRPTQNSEAK